MTHKEAGWEKKKLFFSPHNLVNKKFISAHLRYCTLYKENEQFPSNKIKHTTKPLYVHQNSHTEMGSILMGPHGGTAKTAYRKERSIVP